MEIKWKKEFEESYRAGYRKMLRRIFRMPDGRTEVFDIKDEGCTVCILPILENGSVLLAKQFRPGPEDILLELPGGGVESGEAPEDAAVRELLEETGHEAAKLHLVGKSLCCAYSTRVRYNFVATGCHKVQEPKGDDNEFIETVEMKMADFRKHLQGGRLTDVTTGYLGLDFLGALTGGLAP